MKPQLNSFDRHTTISRVLSALLLVFVLYGTTIEAAHRHGRIFVSDSTTHSISDDQSSGNLGGGSPSCAECLICKLQQHFSASLVTVRDDGAPALTRAESFCLTSAIFITRSHTPASGRAPPVTS